MNAKSGRNALQVYNDEDSPALAAAKATHLPVMRKTAQVRKPLEDVYDFTDAHFEKPTALRIALAEIPTTTNNAEPIPPNTKYLYENPPNTKYLYENPSYVITSKPILTKPKNKFFRHKWVKTVEIPESDVVGDTIWSPLKCDLEDDDDDNHKENYQAISSSEIFLVEEFSSEIYSHLLNLEVKLRPKPRYMSRQPDITSDMRTIVVDWLVEVCEEYKLETETLFLTVAYLDRFLSSMSVVRTKLQLVGTAALFIASKYEEIYPPDLKEFVYITDDTYTKRQVLRMEHLILDVLTFDLAVPTAYAFLERLISLFYAKSTTSEPQRTANLAKYICELSLLDGDRFLKFLPSQIASASFFLAKYTMGQESWNQILEDISGYEESSFKECVLDLHERYSLTSEMKQQAIQLKYGSPKYNCVSLITPPPFFTRNVV